jgi:DNA repair protein RadA/Sms
MSKSTTFACSDCGREHPKWQGICAGCKAWHTIPERPVAKRTFIDGVGLVPLVEVDQTQSIPVPTTVEEIDRVLGGGFVPGSVSLLSGEPGIGKSTLTLQLALRIARTGASVVLVTGEEAPSQVAARASRIHNRPIPETLSVLDTTDTGQVINMMEKQCPQMVIVDSVQMLRSHDDGGSLGSPSLLRMVSSQLAETAKKNNVSLLLIGHVTKDGGLAGPRTLEHLVDTVLSFDGDRRNDLRFLRCIKHRFGPTSEVGLFEMVRTGLIPVRDPSARFLADRNPTLAGSAVVPVLEGRRPVMVEIQALLTKSGERPVVKAHNVQAGRLNLVHSVGRDKVPDVLAGLDTLVSAAGGAKVNDPGADLAMLLAMVSAARQMPVPARLGSCAEIGLSGELRRVATMERRLAETHRLGFSECIVPLSCPEGPTGLGLHRCETVVDALNVLLGVAA